MGTSGFEGEVRRVIPPIDSNPMTVATVTGINLIKVFAAETGFAIMLRLNGRG